MRTCIETICAADFGWKWQVGRGTFGSLYTRYALMPFEQSSKIEDRTYGDDKQTKTARDAVIENTKQNR